jgi:hypothetical protein
METNCVLYQVRAEYFCTCNDFILVDGSLWHGSDGYSPASRPGGQGSISDQSICEIYTGHSGTGAGSALFPSVIPPLLQGHFHRHVAVTMQIEARSQQCCVIYRERWADKCFNSNVKRLN